MSTTIPIPFAVARRLREGAQSAMRSLGDELECAVDDPPVFERLHNRLRGNWRLLDTIGWSDEDDEDGEDAIDLSEHSSALLGALAVIVPMLAKWVTELDDDDQEKLARQDEYRLLRDFGAQARRGIAELEPAQ